MGKQLEDTVIQAFQKGFKDDAVSVRVAGEPLKLFPGPSPGSRLMFSACRDG